MKIKSRVNKGQFSIIAALLVSVILVTSVLSTYAMIRHNSISDSPIVLSAIGEMNVGIKRILDFTVGYYGSILKVTGNSIYARVLTTRYLSSGLVNLARSHPEWNPSFELNSPLNVGTTWFMPQSFSAGNISITYSLNALGIEDIKYEAYSALEVTMLESTPGIARIYVSNDISNPELGLSKDNFWFYKYNYDDSIWEFVNPTSMVVSSDGIYTITIPSGIDQNAYCVQVKDHRGLVTTSFYSEDSVSSGIPHYTYTFDWESTGVLDIYESLDKDTFTIEVLQNGTIKWLGQAIDISPNRIPIPPIAIKSLRLNATVNGENVEIPFQVEDWASKYMVPLGLSSNTSIFNNNKMLVFLVNNDISNVTLWWNGADIVTQTYFAFENVYFDDNPGSNILKNGFLELDVHNFYIISNIIDEPTTNIRADFLRVNSDLPGYGSGVASYIIHNGVVRDILQQEPEFGGGGVDGCPDFYSQVFLTFPANTSYYTYMVRTIFMNTTQARIIDDLSVIQVSNLNGGSVTENGTTSLYPNSSNSHGLFNDDSPTGWDHHWSQVNSSSSGAGIMFTEKDNQNLYSFDFLNKTGALNVQNNRIEVNPVSSLNSTEFNDSLEIAWYGAVVIFDGEPIYTSPENSHIGLWVMVEHPPHISMNGATIHKSDSATLLKGIKADSESDGSADLSEDLLSLINDYDLQASKEVFEDGNNDYAQCYSIDEEAAYYSKVELRVYLETLDVTPYDWRVYVYQSDATSIDSGFFVDGSSSAAGEWIDIDISSIIHQLDNEGFMKVRLISMEDGANMDKGLSVSEVEWRLAS